MEYQVEDMLSACLTRQVNNQTIGVMGTSSTLAMVAILIAKAMHAPGCSFTTPLGGGMDTMTHQVSLMHLESRAFLHSPVRSQQVTDLWETATIPPRAKDRWLQFFRPAQIDAYGNMNNVVIGNYANPAVRLPGSVGIGDLSAFYPKQYSYITRHTRNVFREKVDFRSSAGNLTGGNSREEAGLRWGRAERVFTDLCIFDFDEDGRMRLSSLHPGVTLNQVIEATGFTFAHDSAVAVTEPPTPAELAAMDDVDPLRIRRLEVLSGKERIAYMREIIAIESANLVRF